MDFLLHWDGDDVEDLMIVTSGDATPTDLDAMVAAATRAPQFRMGMAILIDHRATRMSAMTPQEVRQRAELILGREPNVGFQRVAFVMRDTADFGILRQLQGLTEGDRSHAVGIFLDVPAARSWLADVPPG